VLGLIAATTWRRHGPKPEASLAELAPADE
jgi:hypothetical protein